MSSNALLRQLKNISYNLSKKQVEKDEKMCKDVEKVMKLSSSKNKTPVDELITEVNKIIPGTQKKIADEIAKKYPKKEMKLDMKSLKSLASSTVDIKKLNYSYVKDMLFGDSKVMNEKRKMLEAIGKKWVEKKIPLCRNYIQYRRKKDASYKL